MCHQGLITLTLGERDLPTPLLHPDGLQQPDYRLLLPGRGGQRAGGNVVKHFFLRQDTK
jgi:hypothetical protein